MLVNFHVPDIVIHVIFYVFLVFIGIVVGVVGLGYVLSKMFSNIRWW